MSRLVAILAALFLFAIPAKADVALWLHPIPGWTVINVYGLIKPADVRTFEYYTENVNPDATLVTLSSGGGNLWAGIGMGKRVRQKKLIVGVIGTCASSCALIWIGGETGRKFFYQNASLCFHQASYIKGESDYTLSCRIIQSAPGNPLISEYLTKLGYSQDMIEWATAADLRCLHPELAKKFNIDYWFNMEDGQHYTLPGNHGLLDGMTFAGNGFDGMTFAGNGARQRGTQTSIITGTPPQSSTVQWGVLRPDSAVRWPDPPQGRAGLWEHPVPGPNQK